MLRRYIIDSISGKQVKNIPEEREAVQFCAKILVEDYGYPKEDTQTRPLLIDLIFCKIYDERFTKPDDTDTFRADINEESSAVKQRIIELFNNVKKQYSDVIQVADSIIVD